MSTGAWERTMAEVPHGDSCRSRRDIVIETVPGQHERARFDCDCDRDARIAKGIEAALDAMCSHPIGHERDLLLHSDSDSAYCPECERQRRLFAFGWFQKASR
jgi:hypothetical protein